MTLAVTGIEAAFSANYNAGSKALTIPAGTTGLMLMANQAATAHLDSMYLGSVSTSGAGLADSEDRGAVQGRMEVWWIDDIRGRSGDTLHFTGNGAFTADIVYFSANVPLEESSGAGAWGFANLSLTSGAPPVTGGNILGVFIGDKFGADNHAVILGTELHDPTYASYYNVGAADAAVTISNTSSFNAIIPFSARAWAFIYESVVVPSASPDPVTMTLGFNAGAIATSGAAAMDGAQMRAFVLSFNVGRLGSYAKRQVALVGEDIETSEMTAGGSEGDILMQHADVPPTWEPPSAHAHGYSGELLITDEPAGSPLVFADILQNEAEDDLLYEDVNP